MITTIAKALAVVWTLGMIYCFFDYDQLWTYHPVLVSIGFGTFMTFAVHQAGRAAKTGGDEKATITTSHGRLGFAGFVIAAFVGVFIMFYVHFRENKPHFASLHAMAAPFSMVSIIQTTMNGLFVSRLPAAARQPYINYHRAVACCGMIISVPVVILGLESEGLHMGWITYALEALYAVVIALTLFPVLSSGRVSKVTGSQLAKWAVSVTIMATVIIYFFNEIVYDPLLRMATQGQWVVPALAAVTLASVLVLAFTAIDFTKRRD